MWEWFIVIEGLYIDIDTLFIIQGKRKVGTSHLCEHNHESRSAMMFKPTY